MFWNASRLGNSLKRIMNSKALKVTVPPKWKWKWGHSGLTSASGQVGIREDGTQPFLCHAYEACIMHRSCQQQACLPSAERSPRRSRYTHRNCRSMTLPTPSARPFVFNDIILKMIPSLPSLRVIVTRPSRKNTSGEGVRCAPPTCIAQ